MMRRLNVGFSLMFVVAVLMMGLAGSVQADIPAVLNGDFETDTSSWFGLKWSAATGVIDAPELLARVTGDTPDGSTGALQVTIAPDEYTYYNWVAGAVMTFSPVIPANTPLTLSFYAKKVSGTATWLTFTRRYGGGSPVSVQIGSTWQHYAVTLFAPSGHSAPTELVTVGLMESPTDNQYADAVFLLDHVTVPFASTPTFTPDGGIYGSTQNVTVACTTDNATIRYTTDGTDPSETNGTVIASGDNVTISATTTLKAKAWADGFNPGSVKTAAYSIINNCQYDNVLPNTKPSDITWVRDDTGYHTSLGYGFTVGDRPVTVTQLGIWDGPGNETVPFAGGTIGDGLSYSSTVKLFDASWNLLASVTVPSGTGETLVGDFRYVTLGSPIALSANTQYILVGVGAPSFYDTAGGGTQTCSPYITLNWGVFEVDPNSHYAARYFVGPNAQFAYSAPVATPTFTPGGGSYSCAGPTVVTIACATSGATIRYTTDGSDPSEDPANGTVIASGDNVTISATTTLKAKAWVGGADPSAVQSAVYAVVYNQGAIPHATLAIDGNLSDWPAAGQWSPPFVFWSGTGPSLNSLTQAKFAWNDAADLLCVAVRTNEAVVRPGGHLVIGLTKDNTSDPRTGIGATQLCFDIVGTSVHNVTILNEIQMYKVKYTLADPPWGGGITDGAMAKYDNASGTYTYEVAVPLWNDWRVGTSKERLTLSAGETLYVYVCMEDVFEGANGTDLSFYGNPAFYLGASASPNAWTRAAALSLSGSIYTASDLSVLLAAMDTASGDADWNPLADLDLDGAITSTDLALLLAYMPY